MSDDDRIYVLMIQCYISSPNFSSASDNVSRICHEINDHDCVISIEPILLEQIDEKGGDEK